MGNYMIVQEAQVKLPLLATNGVWEFVVEGDEYCLSASIERYLAYLLYGENNTAEVSIFVRDTQNKNATPLQLEAFIHTFKRLHPTEAVTGYNFSMIPLQADSRAGLDLPIPGARATISRDQEKELMQVVANSPRGAVSYMKKWFYAFRARYGLDFSKHCVDQDHYLAISFLQQHGLPPDPSQYGKKPMSDLKQMTLTLLAFTVAFFVLTGYLGLCGLVVSWGLKMEYGLFSIFVFLLGVFLGTAPFLWVASLLKNQQNDTAA